MTDPSRPGSNGPTKPTEPTAPGASSGPARGPARRRPAPVVRWIRGLSQAAYAGMLLAILVILLLIAILANPGDRVGPVQPARPPVGGPGLPATRL